MTIPVCACLIVQDEEKYIERALSNVRPYVNEIIVVDGGSKDNTVEIAKKYRCKVYERKFEYDFAAQRNFAISKCESPWILMFDADEFFSDEFFNLMPTLVTNPPENCVAYQIYRISEFDGEVRGQDFQWRLIKNKSASWHGKIHEGLVFPRGTRGLKVPENFCMYHDHSMKRQLWSNSLYFNINSGKKERPPQESGKEYHDGKWVDVKTQRDG